MEKFLTLKTFISNLANIAILSSGNQIFNRNQILLVYIFNLASNILGFNINVIFFARQIVQTFKNG